MIQTVFKLRPLLWIAAVLLLAFLVSFTWENQTSYDDGRFGSAAFVVMAPFAIAGESIGLDYTTSTVVSLIVLVVGDFFASRKLARRSRAP
jgi:hypothetical protein